MAASSTTYGKAVTETTTLAEAGGTTGAKTSMATESSGMDKGTSGHNTRVTPDNATKTTVTTIQEISQNKLDCQVPEERDATGGQIRSVCGDQQQRTHDGAANAKSQETRRTIHHMYQRFQRLECGNATSDSEECRKEGVLFKGTNDDEDHFGWCRWKGSWWIRVEQGLSSRQRRIVSRGLQPNTSNLMSYIRREIKAEIMMKNASNAHAQRYRLTSGDDDQGVKETRDRDEVDWYDTTEQDTEPRMSS